MTSDVVWGRVSNLTLWVLQAFLAAAFLLFGASKFSGHVVFWVQLFARIGIGQWFRYFTGGLEVICAVLLLIPRTSAVAAALLACTMAGAVFVHVFILGDGSAWVFSGLPLLILVAIAWKRRQTLQ
jgi:putative oxidoreductase